MGTMSQVLEVVPEGASAWRGRTHSQRHITFMYPAARTRSHTYLFSRHSYVDIKSQKSMVGFFSHHFESMLYNINLTESDKNARHIYTSIAHIRGRTERYWCRPVQLEIAKVFFLLCTFWLDTAAEKMECVYACKWEKENGRWRTEEAAKLWQKSIFGHIIITILLRDEQFYGTAHS